MNNYLILLLFFALSCHRNTTQAPVNSEKPAPTEQCIYIESQKMNVFYIGLENPFFVRGMNESMRLEVTSGNSSIKKIPGDDNEYIVVPTRPGELQLTVSQNGTPLEVFDYRSKRIPNPVASLSLKTGGNMAAGEFKAQGGVTAFLNNFDFDCVCQITGFQIMRIPESGERSAAIINQGPRYTDVTRVLVNEAVPGDIYIYTNVKGRCPGDVAQRPLNEMVFMVR